MGLWAAPASAVWLPDLPEGVEPQVLLITDAGLAEAWKPFAVFKTRLGQPTAILTVQEIAAGYEGQDIQQKIRAAVQDYIQHHGTRYVILGGDSAPGGTGLVPDRDTLHREMRYRDIPTDLYYLSPADYGWDANGNGVYGEWPEDMAAVRYTHPSGAAIGRIPVRTAADVAAYTDKVMDYETHYPAGDFAHGMIYANTVDGSEPKVRRSWDDYVSRVWEQGRVFRFYHTETAWDDAAAGDYALNTGHWLDVINRRTAGKMHMHGHGLLGFWILEDDGGHTMVNQRTVDQLTNENAYLVMTTVSCFTGQYDGKEDPSIAESMLRAPNRGAVAIIAPSREGVPIFHNPREDFRLMVTEGKLDGTTESMTRYWMNGLSPREDGRYRTLGQAFTAMKGEMAGHAARTAGYHWCQCELNFLGDPTLDMRARAVRGFDDSRRSGHRARARSGVHGSPVWRPRELHGPDRGAGSPGDTCLRLERERCLPGGRDGRGRHRNDPGRLVSWSGRHLDGDCRPEPECTGMDVRAGRVESRVVGSGVGR